MKILRPLLRHLGHQNYLRFGVRNRIICFFDNPDKSTSEEFEVPFYGKRYFGNFNSFIDWNVYYYGAYSRTELDLMRDFLAPVESPVVVDVGGNVGNHTLFASGFAARVHAFEPFPKVASQLKNKVDRNELENVTLHELALGNAEERKLYHPPSGANAGTGSFVAGDDDERSIELKIVSADHYFPEQGIDRVDFVKIDVEGFEIHVLEGMQETLKTHRPVVFFEWNREHYGEGAENGISYFPENYEFYRFSPDRKVLVFFSTGLYHLEKLEQNWTGENLLAVPIERLDDLPTRCR